MNEQMKQLREKIQDTLEDEQNNLDEYEASMTDSLDMYNCQGWVEALRYVLKQIDEAIADDQKDVE